MRERALARAHGKEGQKVEFEALLRLLSVSNEAVPILKCQSFLALSSFFPIVFPPSLFFRLPLLAASPLSLLALRRRAVELSDLIYRLAKFRDSRGAKRRRRELPLRIVCVTLFRFTSPFRQTRAYPIYKLHNSALRKLTLLSYIFFISHFFLQLSDKVKVDINDADARTRTRIFFFAAHRDASRLIK